ncbi:aldo/keto reductase [Phenylobacterium deserti]|uniref:NADP-dependent oxidoreductase domain-containing protein n=1 Tax=Phenylobacterium deserti TaxID=1914756 RepID=A0A328A8V6_9CAUL|nr:aldo/keto reductase [Phenylobacterium deserti]RAK51010.1 hypothetical protein DJ018_17805 [Phenylobacterium deserti]
MGQAQFVVASDAAARPAVRPIPEAPRLGFGCGGLLGDRQRENSLHVLAVALEAGVTYFDTARLYGEGQAEGLLGETLGAKRHKVIITSKAGILPAKASAANKWARRIGLRANRFSPLKLPVPPPPEPVFGCFEPAQLRASVETSLRELRTDYLDALLLHECSLEDLERPAVQEVILSLLRSGKILAWGAAPSLDQAIRISAAASPPPILQLADSVWSPGVERLAYSDAYLITHSVLARGLRPLLARLEDDDPFRARWAQATGLDPEDASATAQILLAHALTQNPQGTVLFSSSRPANVEDCASLLHKALFTPAQVAAAAALAAEAA